MSRRSKVEPWEQSTYVHCSVCCDSRTIGYYIETGMSGIDTRCNQCRKVTFHYFDPVEALDSAIRERDRQDKGITSLHNRLEHMKAKVNTGPTYNKVFLQSEFVIVKSKQVKIKHLV